MEKSMNEEAPAPKKKELKTFYFVRTMQSNKETPQGSKENKENNSKPESQNDKINQNKENIVLNFILYLYEDEIAFNIKQSKENIKAPQFYI